jgi:hypothetical protein
MSSSYDNLRDLIDDEDSSNQTAMPEQVQQRLARRSRSDGRIFGLSAGQRAFLAGLLFVTVVVIGMALLAATGRMVF